MSSCQTKTNWSEITLHEGEPSGDVLEKNGGEIVSSNCLQCWNQKYPAHITLPGATPFQQNTFPHLKSVLFIWIVLVGSFVYIWIVNVLLVLQLYRSYEHKTFTSSCISVVSNRIISITTEGLWKFFPLKRVHVTQVIVLICFSLI